MVGKCLAAAVGNGVQNSKLAPVRNRVSVMSVPGLNRAAPGKRRWRDATSLGIGALALAGCAPESPQVSYSHGHEHFAQAKYGHASPKVVADGEPVPRGGGQYLVGHPYTVAGHATILPKTRHIRRSAWPPGTARRSMAVAPPTAKSTTWPRFPPPIRRCRCRATRA